MKWEENVRKVVPYVAGEQPNRPNMIKLNTNECPYPPAPGVRKAAENMESAALRLYPNSNAQPLVDELAAYYGVKPEQVFVGVGSDDVLSMAFLTFFNSGKPVLFPDVTYSFYDVWADLYRIPYHTCALDENWHMNPEDYKQPNGGVIFPNPNAPTGVEEPQAMIEEILQANPDVVVIVDEAYVDFGGTSALPLLKKYENLLASFEINDIPFIRKIARTGKPIIMSTGIAYLADIELALRTCKEEGNENVILLKCTSAYPAPYEDINLKTIPSMKEVFDCVVGLSDHTMGCAVAGAGVALGAKVVEKHLTLRRADGGADAAFSMEPEEFKEMVDHIRMIEKAVGKVTYDLTPKQKKSREHSRSLFVAQDMKAGDVFTPENLRSVRPSCGLHTRYYEELLGKRITRDARLGTPMDWSLVDFTEKEQQ